MSWPRRCASPAMPGAERSLSPATSARSPGSRVRRRAAACPAAGIELQVHPGGGVVEPGAVAPAGKDGYRVFGAYARAWADAPRRPVVPAVRRLRQPGGIAPGPRPEPKSVGSTSPAAVAGGERVGRTRLTAFLRSGIVDYGQARGRPDLEGGSRLSPYLRFGCLSPLEVEARALELSGVSAFVRQLAWRDFFRQLLATDPALTAVDLRPPPADRGPRVAGALERWTHGIPACLSSMPACVSSGRKDGCTTARA